MHRIPVIFLFIIFLYTCQKSNTKKQNPPPNIVLIMVDDQGWGDLSINGNPIVNTPNIDKLAKEGLQFEHFYVDAVCSPTRASLLTGRYAVRGGVYSTSAGGERLDLNETTFAEYFQDAGYKTGAFGKWHNGMQPPYHPNARGFEEFYGYCSGHWGSYFDAMLEHNGELVQSKGYLTDVLTDKMLEFIETNKDAPFLAYLPLNTPHSPMQIPDKWWQKFEDEGLPEHRYSDRENLEHSRAAYAMAENIDWNLGRVIEQLEALQLTENTLVIYLSDNGPNGWRWNAGMEGVKGHTNEGGVRSPCMMYWKDKIAAGKVVPEIVAAMDLFPTLLDIAGIEMNTQKPIDGVSLKPLILDENPDWKARTIVNHWRDKTSVRSQYFRLDHENALFNMRADFAQTKDVSADFPKVKAELVAAKKKWQAEVLSELPETDTRSFPLGHPEHMYTQFPARDGIAHGNIQRSNRWPNCSFYTNWTSPNDSITWDVEVLEKGKFEVLLYHTCEAENVGTQMQLSAGNTAIQAKVEEAHSPSLRGAEHDRILRGESYVKDFKPLSMGIMELPKGKITLTLKASNIPSEAAIDFRLLVFKRV